MGQSDSINNRSVKFVVSYHIVFKQVEISTILASVESTGSWLHAGTSSVFCVFSSSRDINIFHVSFHKVRWLIYVQ